MLADPHTLPLRKAPLAWPDTWVLMPSHATPQALATALARCSTRTRLEAVAYPLPFCPTAKRSARELQVLRLVVEGCCNEEIATRLFINGRTVESHRRNLLHKAGAVREGWVG